MQCTPPFVGYEAPDLAGKCKCDWTVHVWVITLLADSWQAVLPHNNPFATFEYNCKSTELWHFQGNQSHVKGSSSWTMGKIDKCIRLIWGTSKVMRSILRSHMKVKIAQKHIWWIFWGFSVFIKCDLNLTSLPLNLFTCSSFLYEPHT